MARKGEKYNGWANYETWLVALWIDNEQGSHEYWRERAEELLENKSRETAIYELSDAMKEEFEGQAEERVPEGFWSDMVGAALQEVDWDEVAQSRFPEPARPKRRARAGEEIRERQAPGVARYPRRR